MPVNMVTPWKAAGDLLHALGITKPAISVALRIDMKSAIVTVEYPITRDEMGNIVNLIEEKRYVLSEEVSDDPATGA